MNSTLSYNHIKNDLVLIGAGHANLKVLKTLAMSPPSGIRITLITDVMQTPYSGMMHGYIAGHFMQNETHIDVNRLCKKLNVRILHSSVTGIDPKKQMIFCDNRPPVSYDYLSINCGSVQNNDTIPGAAEYALSVRPLRIFLKKTDELIEEIKNCRGIFHLVIAGGGPTGVEMSIALRAKINYAMRDMNLIPDTVKVFLCIPDAHVLPGMSKKAVETIEAYIREHRITILNNSRLTAVEKDYVYMTDRKQIAADAVVLATGSGAPEWIVNTGLDTDKNGFICVKKTLQTLKYDNIFAGGDIVSIQGEKTDKSGVYAVRMADSIIYNIHAVISKRACKSYTPQKKAMYILGMEKDFGVLVRGNLAFSAPWVKKLKDYIDRKYVKSFSYPALKDIKPKRTPEDSMMRCGGCGGKVGKALLSDMLCNIKSAAHPDIMLGLNDYSDTACIQVAPDKYLYQSVDFFRELTDDLYLFGKITALHCLNDIYASGATPHSALAVMGVPYGQEKINRRDLSYIMNGITDVLRSENVALTGGHTAETAEFCLGLSVNGFSPVPPKTFTADEPHAIILTKRIGHGIIYAADNLGDCPGIAKEMLIKNVLQSNAAAASVIFSFDGTYATDVTGYGLIGCLQQFFSQNPQKITLNLNAVPTFDGIEDFLTAGYLSSIDVQNRHFSAAVKNEAQIKKQVLYPLLYDPQTSGPLMAFVPVSVAPECLQKLQYAGYEHAAIIGQVNEANESMSVDIFSAK